MTTHIIRGALIDYTQQACEYYEIPTEEQHSGPIWDADELLWQEGYAQLPRTPEGKLLLVPKTIVRHDPIFDTENYFKDYIAPLLEAQELQAGSELVQLLKNGRTRVTRKSIRRKYGDTKLAVVEQTIRLQKQPLINYRQSAGRITSPPLDNEDLAETVGGEMADFMALYEKMTSVQPGNAGATLYHRCAEQLLSAVFYPALGNMKIEQEIHKGRKRIDICYDNVATIGFFDWLNRGYRCPIVPIECKNYQRDLVNPELDQMIGRFSDQRGRFGIIVCRSFENKELFLARCKDTANDRNGFVVVLDDDDLRQLAQEAADLRYRGRERRLAFPLLRERFGDLIS